MPWSAKLLRQMYAMRKSSTFDEAAMADIDLHDALNGESEKFDVSHCELSHLALVFVEYAPSKWHEGARPRSPLLGKAVLSHTALPPHACRGTLMG